MNKIIYFIKNNKLTIAILLFLFPMTITTYLLLRKSKVLTGNPISNLLNGSNMTRGKRNNNPLNIRFNSKNNWLGKKTGEEKKDKEFEEFTEMVYGIRAACLLIRNYMTKNGLLTIETILKKWAPEVENPTSNYIAFVEKKTGFKRHEILAPEEKYICALVDAMAQFESELFLTQSEIKQGYEKI